MRTSGRNGPRSQPNAATSASGREVAFSTFKPMRGPSGGAAYSVNVEKRGAHEEEDVESDSEGAWSRRECARRRQITIGKARPEYRKYIAEVTVEERNPSQPSTPDPRARVSKRQFDRELGLWRRHLHEFDCDNLQGDNLPHVEAQTPDRFGTGNARGSGGRVAPLRTAPLSERRAGERPERLSVQTRRYADCTAPQTSPDKQTSGTAPIAAPPKTVVSISLADELQMNDTDMPLQGSTTYDTSMCNGMWAWPLAMPPPLVDGCPGMLVDPSTPPKHDALLDMQGFSLDGLTPPDKPQRPPREDPFWYMAAMANFQNPQQDMGLKYGQPDFSCADAPAATNGFEEMQPYTSSDTCQQQAFHNQSCPWPSSDALTDSSMSAEVTAPKALEELPAEPLTPRKGARGCGFLAGGRQFMSPGARSPPPSWALETPSPQRCSSFYNQGANQRDTSQFVPGLVLQTTAENFTYFDYVPQQPFPQETMLPQVTEGLTPNEGSFFSYA